ncbi:hypothetical protein A1Q2_02866 [Trichosporon asahii var. asahii CBS 8904]|uniref:Protein arginine N-methyltransferase n=1 Tax=Trichosporon asahii var. asahii (strain CBS 8904) TaxID=1220162 RepID=K1VFI2_TRIAC|nr:hypothetical protein A1Q2_02866 [Trichosporon asahii var. asahii CBS 8904]
MARLPIAVVPKEVPGLPTQPHPSPSPLQQLIAHTVAATDYDAVCVPLTNGLWQDRWERLCLRPADDDDSLSLDSASSPWPQRLDTDREADEWRKEPSLNRDECNITRLEESQGVIALASEWLEIDSPDEGIRFDSELSSIPGAAPVAGWVVRKNADNQGLRAEMQHALYLALPVLVLPAPQLANRAWLPSLRPAGAGAGAGGRGSRAATTSPAHLILILATAEHPPGAAEHFAADAARKPERQRRAKRHRSGRRAHRADDEPELGHQLEEHDAQRTRRRPIVDVGDVGCDPESLRLQPAVDRAAGPEHAAAAECGFIPNAKGYPVLSKACQAFLRGLTRQTPTLVLSDTDTHRHPSGGPNAYLQYVRHITSQGAPASTISPQGPAEVAGGYGDFLQAPLQPLMDDLGAATYDVFERDPVKYAQYEEAIYLAVIDKIAVAEAAGLMADLVIVIAGAGRGPLVTCTLAALERAKRPARVYAVEKNPNAFTTLQERKAIEWGDSVDILFGDMRELPVPELADILVSELLGSFGDNELSPECIDGGMRFLKPDGISIPTSYTAHLAPLASAKLHQDVMSRKDGAAEVPYVVMMQNVNLLSGDGGGASGRCGERIQQCWQFEHPRRDLILGANGLPVTNSHNTRSATLTFHIPHASSCHGFAGYFEAHLYGNIGLSIHPDTAHRVSPDMFSWFPLFFPLREALYLPSGAELEVNIWRLTDHKMKRVWYEWNAEVYLPVTSQVHHSNHEQQPPNVGRVKIGQSVLHNAGGTHYWVGL